jgi:glycosyltransferase involved in cell wall biosynthesis
VAAGVVEGVPPWPCTSLPGLDARDAQPVAGLAALASRLKPDVLHLHTVVNPSVLAWAADQGRAVVTVQDHRYFCPGQGKWTAAGHVCREALAETTCAACFEDAGYFSTLLALTRTRLASIAKMHVTVLSRYMGRELEAVGVPASRVHVIPPFVDGIDPHAEPDGEPCVLFVGRLAHAKGADDAVAAWRASGVPLPLVIAGTGPRRAELERAGASVLGWLAPSDLSRVYARARALVFPSRWQEPFGIAGLEALACGVPVAAWESGGVREWHPGDDLLVPWGDVDALAAALARAVSRPRDRRMMVDPEASMAALEALYRSR